LLTVLLAGGLLALAGLLAVSQRIADQIGDSTGGCLGRIMVFTLVGGAISILFLAIRS
jgi:hypothetical protein